MNWKRTNLERSYICNRDLIKFFRERMGWSQQQLSIESDVSVRVISKAEAGESIATASIARLAAVFAINGSPVYPEDLISNPVEMCRTFMNVLHLRKYRMVDVLGERIEPHATFRITGDPKLVPFAGNHTGLRAYRRALKKFFQIFEFAPSFDHTEAYEYYPSGTDVVLWGVAQVRLIEGDGAVLSLPHRQRFRYRRGKLYSFEEHYDVEQEKRFVSDAVEIQGSKVFDWLEDSSFGENQNY
jgi:transcriptional regulator with XRE-family HTH domain